MQIYSTLGMTNIDDLVNNIFSVFDRLDVSTIEANYNCCFRFKVADQDYPRPLSSFSLDKNSN